MKRSRKLMLLFILFFPVMLFSQGCFISTGPTATTGDLVVAWEFNGQGGCPNDVRDMRIIINNNQKEIEACGAGKRRLSGLVPENYVIRVQGLDIDGTVTWESNERGVLVIAGGTAESEFNLTDLTP
jgi:hypothetical protein